MPWSLDLFAADALAQTGARIRRAGWMDKVWVFNGLYFVIDSGGQRLVAATDYTRSDLFARDWTDQPFTANPCAAVPAYNTAPIVYRQWTDQPIQLPPPPPGFPSA